MTYRLARSLDGLRSEVNAAFPHRDKRSDGWIGDASHAKRGTSDHNPDRSQPLGIVRALDLDKDDKDGSRANISQAVVDTILRTRDPRVKYVIWRGRMFSSYANRTRKAWQWGPYSGPNGHFEHVHVSVVAGSAGDRSGSWGIAATVKPKPAPKPPAPKGPPMSAEQYAEKAAAATWERTPIAGGPTTARMLVDSYRGVGRLEGAIRALASTLPTETADEVRRILDAREDEQP